MWGVGVCCFFFFKQKTAYEIRPCDWSSDVCSSDLPGPGRLDDPQGRVRGRGGAGRSEERRVGKSVRSCVDLGGRRIIKKKNTQQIEVGGDEVVGISTVRDHRHI